MRAPKCRLCGKEHWGSCPGAPQRSEPRPTVEPISVLQDIPKVKPKKKPKPAARPAKRRVKAQRKKRRAVKDGEVSRVERPRGRPKLDEEHLSNERTRPWKRLKVSRRTWYRWQKKAQKANVQPQS